MSTARRLCVVLGLAVAYLVLAALVAVHATDRLDDAVQSLFWPGRHWGPFQARVDRTVNLFSPTHVAAGALALAAVVSGARRSLVPLLVVGGVGLSAAVAELATKWALPRATVDPTPQHFGGTYPSGHVVAAVTLTGALLLATCPRTRWWQWLPVVLLGAAMSAAVQLTAIHRLSDVIGSALLSSGALVTGSALRSALAARRRRGTPAASDPVARV